MQNNSAPPKSSDSNVAEDWNLFGAPGFDLDSNIERIHSRSSSVSLHASDDDQGENNSFEARYKKFLNNFKKSLPSETDYIHFQSLHRSQSVSFRKSDQNRNQPSSYQNTPIDANSYASLPQNAAVGFLSSLAENTASPLKSPYEDIQEGMQIGEFTIGKRIGRGSFSECRMVHIPNESKECKYALKIIKLNQAESTDKMEMIENEKSIWNSLDHPNILKLLEVREIKDSKMIFLVSPLIENGNLSQFVSKNHPKGAPQSLARKIFRQMLEAVKYLHEEKDIAHRDLKLENFLLNSNDNVLLCDFGLAVKEASANLLPTKDNDQQQQQGAGAYLYCAPELFCSSLYYKRLKHLSPPSSLLKADMWSLGVCLYVLLSGAFPFADDFLPRLQLAIISGDYTPISQINQHGKHHKGKEDFKSCQDLISGLLQVDWLQRLSAKEALLHPWINSS